MASIDRSSVIIRNLESRLSDAQARVHWLETDRDAKELVQVERLIELMETKTFSQWFDEVMVRENESLGTAIADIVEDQIDYSDVFRERVTDILATETYELKSDIKQDLKDDIEEYVKDHVDYELATMDPSFIRDILISELKQLNIKVVLDD